jgi:ATP-binding cassette subfamily B protein
MPSPDFHRARKYVNQSHVAVVFSHVASLLAGALFVGWMVLLVFCVDLLDHQGVARFTRDDDRIYAVMLGPWMIGRVPGVDDVDTGLLPTLLRLRGKFYAPALEWAYKSIPLCRSNLGLLQVIFFCALAIGLARLFLLVVQSRLLVSAATDAQSRLQKEIYQKQFELGGSAVDPAPREQIEPILRDHLPTMLVGVKTYMERIVREPSKIAGLLVFALLINPWLGVCFIIMSALAWVVGRRLVRTYFDRGSRLVAMSDAATHRLLGLAGKHRLIAGYAAEDYYTQSFDGYVERAKRATLQRLTYDGRLAPLWQFAGLVIFVIVLALAAQNVLTNKFELSAATGLFASLLSVALPVINLTRMRKAVHQSGESATEIFRFLDLPAPPPQKQGSTFLQPLSETIDFEKVAYEDLEGRQVLSDVSIRIHRGQRIAVMAKTEAERRAFIYLLARFIDPTNGRIKIDGIDIRKGTIESLRAQVVVVLQNDLLFPDTIAGNIACGDAGFGLTQITEAAKMAHAHNFIQRLPNGYECIVGEEGFPLKRGEAYRIALARAIVRDPPIVCIEEPQERLDPDTKSLLDDTMERFCQGRTVIVLPSRISTLRNCDQIFLFNEGKLVAVGTHRELLETSELYRHLQYIDFTTPTFAS